MHKEGGRKVGHVGNKLGAKVIGNKLGANNWVLYAGVETNVGR